MPDEKSEKWNAVLQALGALYDVYCNDTDDAMVAKALAHLMGAYEDSL